MFSFVVGVASCLFYYYFVVPDTRLCRRIRIPVSLLLLIIIGVPVILVLSYVIMNGEPNSEK